MKHLRRVLLSRSVTFAAALAVCLAARPLQGQIGPAGPGNNYYPRTDAPINDNDALELIESLLHQQYRKVKNTTATPSNPGQVVYLVKVPTLYIPDSDATPALPPLPGNDNKNEFPTTGDHYILASDAEIDAAVGAAVQRILDGTAPVSGLTNSATTNGSAHVTVSSTRGLSVGEVISGPGIPAGATIAQIVNGHTIMLNAPATEDAAAVNLEASRSVRSVISAISNYRTKAIKTVVKTAALNILNYQGPTFPATAGGSQVAALEALTAAACEADPAAAAGVVGTILPLVVPKVKGSTPSSPVLLGAAQVARTPSTTLTTASLSAALNSIPDIAKKGGVSVSDEGAQLRVIFGNSAGVLVDKTPTDALAFQNALQTIGLDYYGQFTVVADNNPAKQKIAEFQDDYVITYKPINLNRAGAANWNTTPGFGNAVDEVVTAAMQKAAVNGVAIVNAALGVVMGGVDVSGALGNSPVENGTLATAKAHAQEVSAIAIQVAYGQGRGYLGDEIAVAIGTKVKAANYIHKPSAPGVKKPIATSSEIAAAVFSGPGAITTLKEVGLIAAGLMKGFKGSIFEGGTGGTFVDPDKPEENIAEQIKTTLGLNAAGKTYVDNVQGGFVDAYSASISNNAALVAQAILNGINAGNADNITARLTGGLAWLPGAVTAKTNASATFPQGNFIASVLQKDADLSGAGTIAEIIEMASRSNATQTATIAGFAGTWAKSATSTGTLETERLGKIARGAALGLKGQPLYNTLLTTTVTKIAAASPLVKTTKKVTNVNDDPMMPLLKTAVSLVQLNSAGEQQLRELTSYAITGANEAGHPTAAAGIVLTLGKSASAFYQFYRPILEGAIEAGAGGTVGSGAGTLGAGEQWRAVLALMIPKKLGILEFDGTYDTTISPEHPKPTANFKTLYELIPAYAAGVDGYNSALNDQAIAKGGTVIKSIQDFPKAVFAKAFDAFEDAASDLTVSKAVLTGVALMSPKDAALAGALSVKFRAADAEVFKAEAIGLNPALAANVTIAVDTASHVAASAADLFDYLNGSILKNSKYLLDIVTAATVVAPGYAHVIGHSVGFSSAANVAKVVPALFNYSSLTSPDPNTAAPQQDEYDNRVDAAAALSAGITAGILEAKTAFVTGNSVATKFTVEAANLKNAVVAMVKQVLTVQGNTPVLSPWLPGTNSALSFGATGHDGLPGGGEGTDNFMQSDGTTPVLGGPGIFTSGFTKGKQSGPAGIITGFMSQVMSPSDTVLPTRGYTVTSATSHAIGMVGQILAAAVGAVKSQVKVEADVVKILAIAQAAAQAARSIATTNFGAAGETSIIRAILYAFDQKIGGIARAITDAAHPNFVGNATLANGKPNPYHNLHTKVTNAVEFGRMAADAGVPGAGAAGVINYTHASLSGMPVTDIFGL